MLFARTEAPVTQTQMVAKHVPSVATLGGAELQEMLAKVNASLDFWLEGDDPSQEVLDAFFLASVHKSELENAIEALQREGKT